MKDPITPAEAEAQIAPRPVTRRKRCMSMPNTNPPDVCGSLPPNTGEATLYTTGNLPLIAPAFLLYSHTKRGKEDFLSS